MSCTSTVWLPVSVASPRCISFLHSPSEFFQTTAFLISRAKRRIVLSALYIGTGEKEKYLLHLLRWRLHASSCAARSAHYPLLSVCDTCTADLPSPCSLSSSAFSTSHASVSCSPASSPSAGARSSSIFSCAAASTSKPSPPCPLDDGGAQSLSKARASYAGQARVRVVQRAERGENATGRKEDEERKGTRKPGLRVDILLDYNRGTRKNAKGESSASILASLLLCSGEKCFSCPSTDTAAPADSSSKQAGAASSHIPASIFRFPSCLSTTSPFYDTSPLYSVCDSSVVRVSLFHNPLTVSSFMSKLLPPRLNESLGVQHMKVLIVDDTVLLTGANFSEEYLCNRVDRYVVINDRSLAAAAHDIIATVQECSYDLVKRESRGDSSKTLGQQVVHGGIEGDSHIRFRKGEAGEERGNDGALAAGKRRDTRRADRATAAKNFGKLGGAFVEAGTGKAATISITREEARAAAAAPGGGKDGERRRRSPQGGGKERGEGGPDATERGVLRTTAAGSTYFAAAVARQLTGETPGEALFREAAAPRTNRHERRKAEAAQTFCDIDIEKIDGKVPLECTNTRESPRGGKERDRGGRQRQVKQSDIDRWEERRRERIGEDTREEADRQDEEAKDISRQRKNEEGYDLVWQGNSRGIAPPNVSPLLFKKRFTALLRATLQRLQATYAGGSLAAASFKHSAETDTIAWKRPWRAARAGGAARAADAEGKVVLPCTEAAKAAAAATTIEAVAVEAVDIDAVDGAAAACTCKLYIALQAGFGDPAIGDLSALTDAVFSSFLRKPQSQKGLSSQQNTHHKQQHDKQPQEQHQYQQPLHEKHQRQRHRQRQQQQTCTQQQQINHQHQQQTGQQQQQRRTDEQMQRHIDNQPQQQHLSPHQQQQQPRINQQLQQTDKQQLQQQTDKLPVVQERERNGEEKTADQQGDAERNSNEDTRKRERRRRKEDAERAQEGRGPWHVEGVGREKGQFPHSPRARGGAVEVCALFSMVREEEKANEKREEVKIKDMLRKEGGSADETEEGVATNIVHNNSSINSDTGTSCSAHTEEEARAAVRFASSERFVKQYRWSVVVASPYLNMPERVLHMWRACISSSDKQQQLFTNCCGVASAEPAAANVAAAVMAAGQRGTSEGAAAALQAAAAAQMGTALREAEAALGLAERRRVLTRGGRVEEEGQGRKAANTGEETTSSKLFVAALKRKGLAIITASPTANSFFKSKGVSSYIPEAYAFSAYNVLQHLCAAAPSTSTSALWYRYLCVRGSWLRSCFLFFSRLLFGRGCVSVTTQSDAAVRVASCPTAAATVAHKSPYVRGVEEPHVQARAMCAAAAGTGVAAVKEHPAGTFLRPSDVVSASADASPAAPTSLVARVSASDGTAEFMGEMEKEEPTHKQEKEPERRSAEKQASPVRRIRAPEKTVSTRGDGAAAPHQALRKMIGAASSDIALAAGTHAPVTDRYAPSTAARGVPECTAEVFEHGAPEQRQVLAAADSEEGHIAAVKADTELANAAEEPILFEFFRKNWTFHAKGIWVYPCAPTTREQFNEKEEFREEGAQLAFTHDTDEETEGTGNASLSRAAVPAAEATIIADVKEWENKGEKGDDRGLAEKSNAWGRVMALGQEGLTAMIVNQERQQQEQVEQLHKQQHFREPQSSLGGGHQQQVLLQPAQRCVEQHNSTVPQDEKRLRLHFKRNKREEETPVLTVFGSSNFSLRSERRDLELGAVLITNDFLLRMHMQEEVNDVVKWVVPLRQREAQGRFGWLTYGILRLSNFVRSLL